MYRGVIHFHSKFSYDSITSIKTIVKFAVKNKLNFIVLTDHDTLDGSKALKEYVKFKKLDIEVVVAAEYKTELGDVIALGITDEIQNMEFDSFVRDVKSQEGLLLFPHPYIGHKEIERVAEQVDVIEVFNSRVKKEFNDKAILLADKYDKPYYFASDSHTRRSLKNAIIEFKKKESFKTSLLTSKIKLVNVDKTYFFEIIYSQIIKSVKHKNVKLLYGQLKLAIKSIILNTFFKKV